MLPIEALPTIRQCESRGLTVGEIASRFYHTWDAALPQRWVDEMTAAGFDPVGQFVWSYDSASITGEPGPLTAEAAEFLRRAGK